MLYTWRKTSQEVSTLWREKGGRQENRRGLGKWRGGRLKRERQTETRLAWKVSSTESRGEEEAQQAEQALLQRTWEMQAGEICGTDERQREENGGVCNGAQMNPETYE